jgi:integrase
LTEDEYRRLIRQYVDRTELGRCKLRDVSAGYLDVWYSTLVTARGRRPSPTTLRRVHAVVRQVFDHAERRGFIVRSPADKTRLPRLTQREGRFPADDDVARVIAAAAAVHPARARAFLFLAHSGLRRGELCAVRWSSLAPTREGAELMVSHSVAAPRSGLVVKDPKAHQALSVSLTDDALEVAAAQQDWQRSEADRAGVPLPRDPYLWTTVPPFDTPMWPSTVSSWMARARTDAQVHDLRLHDLRHYTGSAMMRAGATLAEVKRQLRHQSMATTIGFYVHADEDAAARRRVMDRLPSLHSSGGTSSPPASID